MSWALAIAGGKGREKGKERGKRIVVLTMFRCRKKKGFSGALEGGERKRASSSAIYKKRKGREGKGVFWGPVKKRRKKERKSGAGRGKKKKIGRWRLCKKKRGKQPLVS